MCPLVVEIERPASTIRGATTSPRAAASRIARVAPLEVADRGEAGFDRLASIAERSKGGLGHPAGHLLDQRGNSAGVGFEMDVAVDQAGQNETIAEVDKFRPGGRRSQAVANLDDPAAGDDQGGRPPRRPAGPI